MLTTDRLLDSRQISGSGVILCLRFFTRSILLHCHFREHKLRTLIGRKSRRVQLMQRIIVTDVECGVNFADIARQRLPVIFMFSSPWPTVRFRLLPVSLFHVSLSAAVAHIMDIASNTKQTKRS